MFHKTTVAEFGSVLDINVLGTAGVAIAASRVMRDRDQGRIVLVASTAGLHGEPTVSAYATSKGAIIALGRTIAAEGARRNVLTNVLLPYATTQMTDAGMDPRHRDAMSSDAVAPRGGRPGATRPANSTPRSSSPAAARSGPPAASSGARAGPGHPRTVRVWPISLAASRGGSAHEYATAQDAFAGFASFDTVPGGVLLMSDVSWLPLLEQPGGERRRGRGYTMGSLTMAYALRRGEQSIVDTRLGASASVVVAVVSVRTVSIGDGDTTRRLVVLALTAMWGIRLGGYIFARNHGHGEDPRTPAAAAAQHRAAGAVRDPHHLLAAGRHHVAGVHPGPGGDVRTRPGAGVLALDRRRAVWLIGFTFESVGDAATRPGSRPTRPTRVV